MKFLYTYIEKQNIEPDQNSEENNENQGNISNFKRFRSYFLS